MFWSVLSSELVCTKTNYKKRNLISTGRFLLKNTDFIYLFIYLFFKRQLVKVYTSHFLGISSSTGELMVKRPTGNQGRKRGGCSRSRNAMVTLHNHLANRLIRAKCL